MKRLDYISSILAALSVVLWGGLIWLGWIGIQGVVHQHVPGYPASGQVLYYIQVPAAALIICIMAAVVCFVWPAAVWAGRLILILMLLALFPFMLVYTGGV